MDRSSLNQIGLKEAAELLALRREASRQMNGFVKQSDITEQIGEWLRNARDTAKGWGNQAGDALKTVSDPVGSAWQGLMNAKPNLRAAQQSGDMSPYWSATAKEALRNALIGGGIGGGIGALKGIISGEDIFQNMLHGGLGGAALGGAGTGLYRGFNALTSESPSQHQQRTQDEMNAKAMEERATAAENPQATMGQRAGASWEQLTKGDPTRGINMWTNNPNASGMLSRGLAGGNVMADPNQPGQRNFGSAERALGYGGIGWVGGKAINRMREHFRNMAQREHAGMMSRARGATRTANPGMTPGNLDTVHPYRPAQPHLGNRLPAIMALLGAGYGAWEGGQPIGKAWGDNKVPAMR